MKYQKADLFRITSICLTFIFLGLMGASFAHAETLKTTTSGTMSISVAGSDIILPVAQSEAEAFMNENPGKSISVTGGGSGVGFAALINRMVDIATATRAITATEIQSAKDKGVNPVKTTIAYDGITVIVNPTNPISHLTFNQLRGIYNGSIRNWKDVGGLDKPIIAISRDSSSGLYSNFQTLVMNGDNYRPDALALATSGGIVTEVAQNPNAIGYIDFGYLDSTTKALSLDNGKGSITPNTESILSGAYPLSLPFYLYTNGEPTELTKEFINYILSDKGQTIVKDNGYISLHKPKPVPYFLATPTTGTAPLKVQFTDQSTGSPTSWYWVFGDGTTSTTQNPLHTYIKAGNFTVTLTATNAAGSSKVIKTAYIKVILKPPVAAFTATPLTGKKPLTVSFTDKSTNNPTSWSWVFGDGTSSTAKNPAHKYTKAGVYSVKLTVKNAAGSSSVTKSKYISVK